MGKTSLANKYVSECPTYFDACHTSADFRISVKHARTIVLKFVSGELFNAMNENAPKCEKVIARKLIAWIRTLPHITGSTDRMKACSESTFQPSVGAIEAFIRETERPLFLVIDEIGVAFSANTRLGSDLYRVQKDVFLKFCKQVVMVWLGIPNLYILLTGRADFLSLT